MSQGRQQILLIHGGDTFSSDNEYRMALESKEINLKWIESRRSWKNELQDQIGSEFVVYTPQMPNKQNAQYADWKILFEKVINQLDNRLVLVAHSLGAAFILKFLSENSLSIEIKRIYLLGAPFDGEGMGSEKLNTFLQPHWPGKLEQIEEKLCFYHSTDDFAVPYRHFEDFRRMFPKASFRKFEDRNHFLQPEVPELVQDIKEDL